MARNENALYYEDIRNPDQRSNKMTNKFFKRLQETYKEQTASGLTICGLLLRGEGMMYEECLDEWELELNWRLNRSLGRSNPFTNMIELNVQFMRECSLEQFDQIMEHEMVHCHGLYDHNDAFYKKLGMTLDQENDILRGCMTAKHYYHCDKCSADMLIGRKLIYSKLYRCDCGGEIKFIEKRKK